MPNTRLLGIIPSARKNKRFSAIFVLPDNKIKITHFGDSRYESYIDHHDKIRRDKYQRRHKKDLDTGDPTRAGYLSYLLLWSNSTDMNVNIKNYKKLFNID